VQQSLREVEVGPTFRNDPRSFPALGKGETLGNVACNLSRDGATKLRDKLHEQLPSVTAP